MIDITYKPTPNLCRLGYDGEECVYFDRAKLCDDPNMVDEDGNRLNLECSPVELCAELEAEVAVLHKRILRAKRIEDAAATFALRTYHGELCDVVLQARSGKRLGSLKPCDCGYDDLRDALGVKDETGGKNA